MNKVLVIDKSRTIQKVISLVLSKKDFQVDEALSVNEAKQNLSLGIYDLILLDPILYDNSFKTLFKGVPVVLLSDNKIDPNNYRDINVKAVLQKPFTSDDLIEIIGKALSFDGDNKEAWNINSFDDPNISEILEDIKEKADNKEHKDFDRTEVTNIIKNSMAKDVLDDLYEETSNKTIVNDIETDISIIPEEDEIKLLQEHNLKKNKDGTIEFNEEKTLVDVEFNLQDANSSTEDQKKYVEKGNKLQDDEFLKEDEDFTSVTEQIKKANLIEESSSKTPQKEFVDSEGVKDHSNLDGNNNMSNLDDKNIILSESNSKSENKNEIISKGQDLEKKSFEYIQNYLKEKLDVFFEDFKNDLYSKVESSFLSKFDNVSDIVKETVYQYIQKEIKKEDLLELSEEIVKKEIEKLLGE